MDIYQTVSAFYTAWQGEKRIIGKSWLGRNIYAVKVGNGRPTGVAQYAIHGREYITAKLGVTQAKVGVFQGSLWLVLLANPDGALLSETGLCSVKKRKIRNRLLRMNGDEDFSLWKANARGVDLNVNFDARWGKGDKNVRVAGRENYIGPFAFSEPETLALRRFTLQILPDYTLSYHTKGEEIYWYFHQPPVARNRDYRLAQFLSNTTGYPLCDGWGSVGGYKDWCIQSLGIASFTIEAGLDSFAHPLQETALQDITAKNKYAIYALSKEIKI